MSLALGILIGMALGFIAGFIYCTKLIVRNEDMQKRINNKVNELHREGPTP